MREQTPVCHIVCYPRPALSLHRGDIVAGQIAAQTSVQTLIKEEAHLHGGQSGSHEEFAPALNEGHRLLAFHRGETFEKIFEAVAAFEVIEQGLHGHAGSGKARRAAHELGVHDDDFAQLHEGTLALTCFNGNPIADL